MGGLPVALDSVPQARALRCSTTLCEAGAMWFMRTFGGSIVGVFLFWTLYLLNLWLDFIPKWEPYNDSYDSYSGYSEPYSGSEDPYDPYGSTQGDYSSTYGEDPYASTYGDAKMEEPFGDYAPYETEMAPEAPGSVSASTIREQLAGLDTDIAEDFDGNIYRITVRSLVFNSDLVTISQATRLEELTLEQPQYIDDEGLRHLSGLTQLRSVSLRYASVTDSGLYHLEGLSNLTTLDLTGTQVTFDGVSRLRSVLPGCTVIY
jgi:hypothetical protein